MFAGAHEKYVGVGPQWNGFDTACVVRVSANEITLGLNLGMIAALDGIKDKILYCWQNTLLYIWIHIQFCSKQQAVRMLTKL